MEVVDGQKVAHQGHGFLWKRLQGLGHSRLEHKKAAPFPKLLNIVFEPGSTIFDKLSQKLLNIYNAQTPGTYSSQHYVTSKFYY